MPGVLALGLSCGPEGCHSRVTLGRRSEAQGLCLLAVPVFLTALMCGLVAPTENVPGPGLSPVTVSPDPALGLRVASPANPSAGS